MDLRLSRAARPSAWADAIVSHGPFALWPRRDSLRCPTGSTPALSDCQHWRFAELGPCICSLSTRDNLRVFIVTARLHEKYHVIKETPDGQQESDTAEAAPGEALLAVLDVSSAVHDLLLGALRRALLVRSLSSEQTTGLGWVREGIARVDLPGESLIQRSHNTGNKPKVTATADKEQHFVKGEGEIGEEKQRLYQQTAAIAYTFLFLGAWSHYKPQGDFIYNYGAFSAPVMSAE
ncbi:hypothetical protein F2P81_000567 [Scophthalmus maximus]|uniref:Uncharacterized protein n=1 Tax=Scophthalmus maximus TaxID=52904 RepID=A0A6A4TUQ4_SCOMX|nr:hypothetical protein F2P81_000567 [Scophthalmus maximus]